MQKSPRWQDALQLGDVILYRTDTPNARPNRHLVCDLATVNGKRWAALCAASDMKPPLPFRLGAEQPDGLALFDRTSLPGFFASKPRCVDLEDPGFTFDAEVGSPVVGMLTYSSQNATSAAGAASRSDAMMEGSSGARSPPDHARSASARAVANGRAGYPLVLPQIGAL